jgi:hypothetical protein
MQSSGTNRSPRFFVGAITGALVFTCFGAIWGLQGPRIMLVITPVVTVALLALGLTTRQAARRLPQGQETAEERARDQKIARRFGLVVGAEAAAIAVAVLLLALFKHPEYIAAVICLIVGLHLLPLASLFQIRVYALVGIALSLLGAGALLAMLFGLLLGGLWTWPVVVGLASAGVLWLASLVLLLEVRRALLRLR